MTAGDFRKIVDSRKLKRELVQSRIDFLYTRTDDMLKAIEGGADKQECYNHWVTIIEQFDNVGQHERDYYNAHALGLVGLLEDFMKAEDKE